MKSEKSSNFISQQIIMTMNEVITKRKKEIIKWINSIEDAEVIEQIENFQKQQAFDFEKELKNTISMEELKKRTTDFLQSLEWKK